MKQKLIIFIVVMALALALTGCSPVRPDAEAPAAQPQAAAEAPAAEPARQDGERFETVVVREGMEETVGYEHIRSESAGFEMDYEYEAFERHSEPDGETFVSVWDDPGDPWNCLEVKRGSGNAELTADALIAALSADYRVISETVTLDGAGSCLHLDASEAVGGGMPERLQSVYIIPAGEGCLVATAHYTIESAEGFGSAFRQMVNTICLIGG